jgi:hypothetical protein
MNGSAQPCVIWCSVFSFEGVMVHTPFERTNMATRLLRVLSVRPQVQNARMGNATLSTSSSVSEDKPSFRYLNERQEDRKEMKGWLDD